MHTKKFSFFLSLIFLRILSLDGQDLFYGNPVQWENKIPAFNDTSVFRYKIEDLIILDESTHLSFYSRSNEKITRYVRYYVNSFAGVEKIKSMKFPESFDPAYDRLFKQGRQTRISTPYISEYKVRTVAARKFARNRWTPLQLTNKFEKIRWIRKTSASAGEFRNEDILVVSFEGIKVGDIVDIYYEADFNSHYGSNIFYLTSSVPKLRSQYIFTYRTREQFFNSAFILPVNIPNSAIRKEMAMNGTATVTHTILLTNLPGVNYPGHSFGGKKLPYVFCDFSYYRILNNSYPSEGSRIYDISYYRPANFEWIIIADTLNDYQKIYDKQSASIRKFLKGMPVADNDSTRKIFYKALCDTFNNFRFLTSNQVFYNEPSLQDVYSGDHLLRRRLVEHSLLKVYNDILNESQHFYYVVNVQDRRLGEHTVTYRANYAYENKLIALPHHGSYLYFMPRYNGLKYHLNELPFYYEGSLARLHPANFQKEDTLKSKHLFKFIRTHEGTYNENTRTENAVVKISLDSAKSRLTIKESLSGQFSTLLRPLYLGDVIDSTVSPFYFKRCTEKPGAREVKTKLSSKISDFPFRYTFNCSETVQQMNSEAFDLKNWFSFVLSKTAIPVAPTHEYFFDFEFTDSYNFQLEFNESVELKNAEAFKKEINNDYFEFESGITKNSESSYLLRVKLLVKQSSIPINKMNFLMELIAQLEEINNFSLQVARKI